MLTGYQKRQLAIYLVAQAKRRVEKKRQAGHIVPFNLTPDLLIEHVEFPRYCPYLGVELIYDQGFARDYSPTLDRIVNDLGYVIIPGVVNNVVICSQRGNRAKSDLTPEELEKLAVASCRLRTERQLDRSGIRLDIEAAQMLPTNGKTGRILVTWKDQAITLRELAAKEGVIYSTLRTRLCHLHPMPPGHNDWRAIPGAVLLQALSPKRLYKLSSRFYHINGSALPFAEAWPIVEDRLRLVMFEHFPRQRAELGLWFDAHRERMQANFAAKSNQKDPAGDFLKRTTARALDPVVTEFCGYGWTNRQAKRLMREILARELPLLPRSKAKNWWNSAGHRKAQPILDGINFYLKKHAQRSFTVHALVHQHADLIATVQTDHLLSLSFHVWLKNKAAATRLAA